MPSTEPVEPTPQRTDVVGARIAAQIVDLIAMFVILVVFTVGLTMAIRPETRGAIEGLTYLSALALPLYGGLLEGRWNGQTIGKRLMGIKVVDGRGVEPTVGTALVRNVPAILVFSWLSSLVALAAIASNDRGQRLFDMIANTYVVDTSSRTATARRESDDTSSDVGAQQRVR